jgi:hypothetical protein
MSSNHRTPAVFTAVLLSSIAGLAASSAWAVTNQFRGVNWADSRDNFQSGVLYVSGLSSSDTYDSAFAVGNAVMSQFISKLGANAVRLPINEATVSQYWGTYAGAIDAVLAKGMVVFCYWDSAKTNKPPDMNAFWNMWKTVVDKYGGNDKAYFEIFNEPNMYSKTELGNLYNDWLTRFSTVPKGRVILDGTGNAQNVPDVGSDNRLAGCLLAVHDYSFFGSESMTSESQWADHIKGSVGSYADRTICTEWGGPMSPGSKNGKNYDYLDYSKTPTNYFEAYIRGISSQLRAWNMGSFYWPGLRDGDWYSMTIKSGSGANITLSIPNQSGLDRLQYAWTGPPPSADAGAGGAAGRDGAAAGGAGGAAGSSGTGTGGGGGGASGGTGGAGGGGVGGRGGSSIRTGGAGGGGVGGRGGSSIRTGAAGGGGVGGASVSSGGSGGVIAGSGGVVATGGTSGTETGPARTGGADGTDGSVLGSGGSTTAQGGETGPSQATSSGGALSTVGSGGAGSGGASATGTPSAGEPGCSCAVGRVFQPSSRSYALVLAFAALAAAPRVRRFRQLSAAKTRSVMRNPSVSRATAGRSDAHGSKLC